MYCGMQVWELVGRLGMQPRTLAEVRPAEKVIDRHQGPHQLVGWRGETLSRNRRDSASPTPW